MYPLRRGWRMVAVLNTVAAAFLCLWGTANVLVDALVLSGATHHVTVDRHALRWHVFVWDAWLLVWGVALVLAVAGAIGDRRRRLAPHR